MAFGIKSNLLSEKQRKILNKYSLNEVINIQPCDMESGTNWGEDIIAANIKATCQDESIAYGICNYFYLSR